MGGEEEGSNGWGTGGAVREGDITSLPGQVDDDDRDFRRARSRHGSPLATNDIGPRKRRIEQVEPPKRSIRQRLGVKEDDHRKLEKLLLLLHVYVLSS